jgi:hypothetical protein
MMIHSATPIRTGGHGGCQAVDVAASLTAGAERSAARRSIASAYRLFVPIMLQKIGASGHAETILER